MKFAGFTTPQEACRYMTKKQNENGVIVHAIVVWNESFVVFYDEIEKDDKYGQTENI